MNIALVLHTTDSFRGATKAIMRILGHLREKEVRVFFIVPDNKGIYEDLKKQGHSLLVINYRPCAYPGHRNLKAKLLFSPRLVARIILNKKAVNCMARYLQDKDIHLIHTNTSIIKIGYDCARKLGLPHIYHIHEYADLMGYRYFPNQQSFVRQLRTSYSICITKDVQSHYGLTTSNFSRVIYNGIRSTVFDRPVRSSGEGYFLFAGRIEPNKGLDILLRAYKEYVSVARNVIPLYVAGAVGFNQQQYMVEMKQYIIDYQLQQLVCFMGERDDIDTIMREARAIVIPSLYEGFGLCMPEAMFNGCLAIGHNTTGTKEQLDNGLELKGEEIGLRYDTEAELTRCLTDVADKPSDVYTPYVELAFSTVNSLYTTERNAEQVYQFYQEVVGKR